MMRRCAIGVVIAVMAAGGAVFAQDQGRVVKDPPSEPFSFTVSMGSCPAGFEVLQDMTFEYHHSMTLYDKQGRVAKVLTTWKFPRARIYNALDPDNKLVWSGPGENQLTVDIYGDNNGTWGPVFAFSAGLPFKVVVPGHGPIQLETGSIAWDITGAGPDGWVTLHNSGHNDLYDANWQILCDYLK